MCSSSLARFLVLALNLLVLIFACACLGVGIWLKVDDDAKDISELVDISLSSIDGAATLFIVVGLIIFFVAFFGCFGAWKKYSGFLLVYIIIVGVTLIIELIVVIVAATSSDSVKTALKENMLNNIKKFDETESVKDAINSIQEQFKCCGAESLKDFEQSYWWANSTRSSDIVPASCCVMNATEGTPLDAAKCQEAAGQEKPSDEYLHTVGCYNSLVSWANDNKSRVIGFGVTHLLIQFNFWGAAIYLRILIKKEEETGV